ncbi:MAG TPA: EutN/CcmL family microcompartment protein [Acidobacteriota bacterium]|jgi:ethanolamine utilization protein EutN
MIIGRIVSQLVATQKNPKLSGAKLLVVQPLDLDGNEKGETVLAIDAVDAGVGERVLVVQEGWSANYLLGTSEAPVDAAVIGIVDRIDLA